MPAADIDPRCALEIPVGREASQDRGSRSAGGDARTDGAVRPEVLAVTDERIAISPADVHALRDVAAPLLAELASRRLCRTSTPARPS